MSGVEWEFHKTTIFNYINKCFKDGITLKNYGGISSIGFNCNEPDTALGRNLLREKIILTNLPFINHNYRRKIL